MRKGVDLFHFGLTYFKMLWSPLSSYTSQAPEYEGLYLRRMVLFEGINSSFVYISIITKAISLPRRKKKWKKKWAYGKKKERKNKCYI